MVKKGKEGGNQWKVIDLVGTGDKLQLRTGHNAIKLGEWMHLALVVDCDVAQSNPSEKYKLYINGSRVAWGEIKRNDLNFSEIDLCTEMTAEKSPLVRLVIIIVSWAELYLKHVSGLYAVRKRN